MTPISNQTQIILSFFTFVKKGVGVDLISATLNVKMSRDGTPVRVRFSQSKFWGKRSNANESSQTSLYESWKEATAWSFQMEIPDGGFIEESDEFSFEGPEDGYQQKIASDFKAGQPDWKTYYTKNYYFVFGNPPRFGRLTVETDITWGGARLTYTVNPSGARNLEPKNSNP